MNGSLPGALRLAVLGISPREASLARRGFLAVSTNARDRLEAAGRAFIWGYRAGLLDDRAPALADRLDAVELDLRGFAYEGAAMALALLDEITPWQRARLASFLAGPGAPHRYMVHVGAGWALARLGRPIDRPLARLDPILGWLAIDGYGFHEAYFRASRTVSHHQVPRHLTGYAVRAFSQGVGRGLWFVHGVSVPDIAASIAAFPAARHADLWSGVGLACTYAGGADRSSILLLRDLAGQHRGAVAQGAAFAATARVVAGNPTEETQRACTLLAGASIDQAAALCDAELGVLRTRGGQPDDSREPAYETWRRRIQVRLVPGLGTCDEREVGEVVA